MKPPLSPLSAMVAGAGIGALAATILTEPDPVRRVFFSFHFQRDIWRVNQVKKHWVAKDNRQAAGYFDGSLEELAKTEGSTAVKRAINKGLNGQSVTCVLIGAETYNRHWVDYEIFKSIESGMGVFGVRIHGLKNQAKNTDTAGTNPFSLLGYGANSAGKLIPNAKYTNGWKPYSDAAPILPSAAPYLKGRKNPVLSDIFKIYNWVTDDGYSNFSNWAAAAARQAGR